MPKIWNEDDVTLDNLAEHLTDAGLVPSKREAARIVLHTESGVGYFIALDEQKKFIRFATYLPLAQDAPDVQKLALEHRLNRDVFLSCFSISEDNLGVFYAMSYQQGVIAGQFMAIANRFASMLEFVVCEQNDEGLILFGPKHVQSTNEEPGLDARLRDDGILLN